MFGLKKAASVRDAIFDGDPYGPDAADPARVDMQGWGEKHEIFAMAVETVRPEVIVELGVWKGMTCIRLAKEARERGLAPQIIAVDTWLGAPRCWTDRSDPTLHASLQLRGGYPTLYETFVANIHHEGVQDLITPLPNTTENAAIILKDLKIAIDVLHIDADHETEPVLRDLRAYYPLMRKGGWLIGDDYKWPTVKKAAEIFATETQLELKTLRNKFWFEL